MMPTDKIGLWSVGALLAGVALIIALQAASQSRLRRRRRKNNSRVISKHKGPSVKFSVKTPKED